MPNPIGCELKEAHKAVSRILITLAGIPLARKDLLDAGNRVTASLVYALAAHINDESKGSGEQRIGQLNSWMCSILRLSRDKDSSLDPLRNILDRTDLGFMDRLTESLPESLPEPKPERVSCTPVTIGLTVLSEEQKIGCRAGGCNGKYSTKKAYNLHLRKKHSADAKRLRLPEGEEHRLAKQTIICMVCGDRSVDVNRYNEHYKALHDKQFVAAGRKVRLQLLSTEPNIFRLLQLNGFHRYSDGRTEPKFIRPERRKEGKEAEPEGQMEIKIELV